MKKQVFIHIGFGKTGTTSIQGMLCSHSDILSQHGTLYPRTGRLGNSHAGLSALPAKRDELVKREGQLAALKAEFIESGCDRLIVSAESLCFSVPDLAGLFAGALGEFSVQVMMYIRRQEDLVASTYLQWVKTGWDYRDTIEDFFSAHRKSFDFQERIAPWAKAFGNQSIAVYLYDRRLIPDICRQFLDSVGHSGQLENLDVPELNVSLLPEFAGLVRSIDSWGIEPAQREGIIKEMLAISSDFKPCSTKRLISSSLAKKIAGTFEPSNRYIARKYLDERSRRYFLETYTGPPSRS